MPFRPRRPKIVAPQAAKPVIKPALQKRIPPVTTTKKAPPPASSTFDTAAMGISLPERPIKLVAIDLDGTLLNTKKQISDKTAKALACLPKQGVRVVIASARPPRSVRHIYRALGLDTLQINYNGALIWDELKGRSVFHRPMSGSLVQEMIELSRAMYDDVSVSCEVLDRWYTDRAEQPYLTETGRMFKPDVICDIEEFCDGAITKLMFLGPEDMMSNLTPVLNEKFGGVVTVLHADRDLIQIMDKRVSKAVALKKVAEGYGVNVEEIMAIGDAPNDVGMLQLSGVAVAMDNAHDVVKKVADWIAPSNDDHGVHAALVRYGLCS